MIKFVLFTLILFSKVLLIAQDYTFYSLSSDVNNEKPLYLCSLNAETGIISVIERYAGTFNGNYLALSADKKHLLATSKGADFTKSGIVQYDIADDGTLTFIKDEFKASGDLPCYVSFTPDMNYVLSANYGDDEISLYSFSNKKVSSEIDHVVKTDKSKGHFIQTDLSGKFVHAVFLGLNKVFSYTIINDKFVENQNQNSFSLPNGYGPRHLVFHPNNKFVYILNETHSSVTACIYDSITGVFTEMHNISMLPSDFTGTSNAAAIRIHPSGKFLYASNRGHNSIVAYQIAENGHLTLIEIETSRINFPRDFNLSSDGKYMIIANQKGSSIMSLKIDQENGKLENTNRMLTIDSPLSIIFLPVHTDGNTDVNEFIQEQGFVFPNPSSGTIHLKFQKDEALNSIELFDMNGQLVKKLVASNSNTIQLKNLSKGTYLLLARSKNKLYKQTVFIQ